VYCRAGGACSAPGGEAICVGISHRLWCGESRMGFDPGDGLVMMPADYSEKGPDPPDEGLVAAGFDGVVAEEADAVLAVGEEIDALPDHSGERSGSATNPEKGVVNRTDLSRIVRGTGGADPVGIRAVRDDGAPKGDGGGERSGDEDTPSCRGRVQRGGAIRVQDDVWVGERSLTEGHRLGDVLLSFPACFESLVITPYAYGVRLGLFPGGIDARYVTQPDTVEYFRFLDRRGENGLYLHWRARRVIGSAPALCSTASMHLACFRASHIASIRGTRVEVRTEAKEVSWAEFQLPRQIR